MSENESAACDPGAPEVEAPVAPVKKFPFLKAKPREVSKIKLKFKPRPRVEQNSAVSVNNAEKFDQDLALPVEKTDLNQYWYTNPTVDAMLKDLALHREWMISTQNQSVNAARRGICFLSSPSVFFAWKKMLEAMNKSDSISELESSDPYFYSVFEYDKAWENEKGFVFYDFNHPENIPEHLHHTYSMVVIDPPFITEDVWDKYAIAARELLVTGSEVSNVCVIDPSLKADFENRSGVPDFELPRGRIMLSTIAENITILRKMFDTPIIAYNFRPSIPNLPYQYNLFGNYPSPALQIPLNPEIDS